MYCGKFCFMACFLSAKQDMREILKPHLGFDGFAFRHCGFDFFDGEIQIGMIKSYSILPTSEDMTIHQCSYVRKPVK